MGQGDVVGETLCNSLIHLVGGSGCHPVFEQVTTVGPSTTKSPESQVSVASTPRSPL